jgi:hypothetical protein
MALNTRCDACGTRLGAEDYTPAGEVDCLLCKKIGAAKPEANPFADAGRARFVLKMVEVIDRNALAQEPPINPFDQAGRIALAALGWDERTWKSIARRANPKRSKPPSPESRRMLIEVYRGRSRAPLTQKVAS